MVSPPHRTSGPTTQQSNPTITIPRQVHNDPPGDIFIYFPFHANPTRASCFSGFPAWNRGKALAPAHPAHTNTRSARRSPRSRSISPSQTHRMSTPQIAPSRSAPCLPLRRFPQPVQAALYAGFCVTGAVAFIIIVRAHDNNRQRLVVHFPDFVRIGKNHIRAMLLSCLFASLAAVVQQAARHPAPVTQFHLSFHLSQVCFSPGPFQYSEIQRPRTNLPPAKNLFHARARIRPAGSASAYFTPTFRVNSA